MASAVANFFDFTTWPAPIMPTPPDFYLCDRIYGSGIKKQDCKDAGIQLPHGRTDVQYSVGTGMSYMLPLTVEIGTCMMTVEVAGGTGTQFFTTTPQKIRGMAGWVIKQCVRPSGLGGFVTLGIDQFVNYISNPDTSYTNGRYPISTAFITLTVTNKQDRKPSPGDFDPSVALLAAQSTNAAWKNAPVPHNTDTASRVKLSESSRAWIRQSAAMKRGGDMTPYWRAIPLASDDMVYECDDTLGHPAEVDCSQLEYSQLGPDLDTIQVEPGIVRFLTSNTCNVAITATSALVLNWLQIRTALDALLNVCVSHPLNTPQGGRAYYGTQPLLRRSNRIRQQATTGLNALPPGANITVYAQPNESWQSDPVAEQKTCTWQSVLHGGDVASCPKT